MFNTLKTRRPFLIAALLLLFATGVRAFDTSYWVWQRSSPLEAPEITELKTNGVTELYWHVGTLVLHDKQWSWREQFPVDFPALKKAAPSLHFIPVVRLEPVAGQSLSTENQAQLLSLLKGILSTSKADALQIDYECPDRVISQYTDFLRSLKEQGRTWRLSISALGHWSKFANDFQGLADELTPMFYDLNPNREAMNGGLLPPLIDEAATEKQIEAWKTCKVPWKAGLPNFGRLSVVNVAGQNRGNIRSWSLDELCYSSLLASARPTTDGQTVFTITSAGVVANTPVQPGEKVVLRYPVLDSLLRLQAVAKQTGATGTIFFRLTDRTDMSGFSIVSLSQEKASPSTLTVKWMPGGRLAVTNTSKTDLMPAVFVSGWHGYALELETKAGSWREAVPGDFAFASSGANGTHPFQSTIGLDVSTVYFGFNHLRAGQTLETGLVQRVSTEPIRWRIHNLDPETSWHSLE